ncbi:MAG: hypothetical protein BWY83_03124 [bacterium ADurb.Bin478]|nr:MAG: hypothetical protein BWY83_03124 [bacterium ADurb.Bin478]
MAVIKHQKIIGLQQLVVELEKGESLFHADLVGLIGEHAVDAEVAADVAQKFDIFEFAQPVVIVDHDRLARTEIEIAAELYFDLFAVGSDRFAREHLAHLALAARIPDHGRAAADDGDGAVAELLHLHHPHHRHEMANVEAVGGGVDADIKSHRPFGEQLLQGFRLGDLLDESAPAQFLICFSVVHKLFSALVQFRCRSFSSRSMSRLTSRLAISALLS